MSNLPTPSNEALAHSEKLKQHLMHYIRQHNNCISFAEFMQLTLYAPGLGYYACGNRKFGPEGDFITAPELSPLFSHCIARQHIEISRHLNENNILEIGAGSGIMAADILCYLEQQQQLPDRYFILEASPELQQRQKDTLLNKAAHLISRVEWLSELPNNFSGTILANELLDALPAHLFEVTKEQLQEKCITVTNDQLTWTNVAADETLTTAVNAITEYQTIDAPYSSELNLALPHFIGDLQRCLSRGVILFIDYGFPQQEYYHPDRSSGTLMCHYRHHAHPDPLLYLGLQDITAHVDFTAVAVAAELNDLDLLGYTNQASFLLNTGLIEHSHNDDQYTDFKQKQAVKMLTLPSEMGELFKVMALGKHYDHELKGFATLDQSHRL